VAAAGVGEGLEDPVSAPALVNVTKFTGTGHSIQIHRDRSLQFNSQGQVTLKFTTIHRDRNSQGQVTLKFTTIHRDRSLNSGGGERLKDESTPGQSNVQRFPTGPHPGSVCRPNFRRPLWMTLMRRAFWPSASGAKGSIPRRGR
jgi:hypothetical protein